MISGDRKVARGQKGPFFHTLGELRHHWERIDVITPRVSQHLPQNIISVYDNVYFHPSPWGLWRQPQWIVQRGRELIQEHRHDVMTVHAFPPFYTVFGAQKLSRCTGIPYVLELHGLAGIPSAASIDDWIGGKLTKWVIPWIAPEAAGIRVIQSSMKAQMMSWGVPEKIIAVLPSFYREASVWKPAFRQRPRYDVLFIGRIDTNKRLDRVIEAIAQLPNLTLLVVGDGPQCRYCERLTQKLQVSGRVHFAGWVPEAARVAELINDCKCLVMASASEGGPRVALEAMACGVPVISTQVGVMPDILKDGENGMFTTGTVEDLAQKIAGLLADETRRRIMGARAAQSLGAFDSATLISAYSDFLKKCSTKIKA